MNRKARKPVRVRLLCIYSGAETAANPGSVIEVDEAEAARLVSLGAAVRV